MRGTALDSLVYTSEEGPLRLGVGEALVDGETVAGDVAIEDGLVVEVGLAPAGSGLAVPGFVDAHINGYAGVDFLRTDRDGYRHARAALAATGVVAVQPTFVSSARAAYAEPTALAAAVAAEPDGLALVTGVHLEGPFLSADWAGAHDPAHLRGPDPDLLGELLGHGPVTMVTLAPELPGALESIRRLVDAGVVVSCGHSGADADAARAAFDAGATALTHVHNAHRRWRARDPGLGGVALVRPGVYVQAIVDGVHLAPESALAAWLTARERLVLVTDAIEAAGAGEGRYMLGDRPVAVSDGAVRLPDGTLAGSVSSMDAAVRRLVALGVPVADAVHAASSAPARMLGRRDLGVLRPGSPAHVAVLDGELNVTRTLVGGVEAFATA